MILQQLQLWIVTVLHSALSASSLPLVPLVVFSSALPQLSVSAQPPLALSSLVPRELVSPSLPSPVLASPLSLVSVVLCVLSPLVYADTPQQLSFPSQLASLLLSVSSLQPVSPSLASEPPS